MPTEQEYIDAISHCLPGQQRIDLRLVYADYLDELGDLRGELIRCFIERHKLVWGYGRDRVYFGRPSFENVNKSNLWDVLYTRETAIIIELELDGQEAEDRWHWRDNIGLWTEAFHLDMGLIHTFISRL